MSESLSFEKLSEVQNEILSFTLHQIDGRADKFFVQGKIAANESGKVTMRKGQLEFAAVGNKIVNNSDVLDDHELRESVKFIRPRINEIHDLLIELQGKSPVRFRWSVDTRTGAVDSEWTYYDDLTEQEKKEDWWEHWDADFAWRDQLQAELDAQS